MRARLRRRVLRSGEPVIRRLLVFAWSTAPSHDSQQVDGGDIETISTTLALCRVLTGLTIVRGPVKRSGVGVGAAI